jgi:very-short-patch-repair endonuclease
MPPLDLPDAEIAARYRAGESVQALAQAYGVSRPNIDRRLHRLGVERRGQAAANALRMKRLGPEARLALAQAAHAAVRGVPQPEERLCKSAITVERKGIVASPDERALAGWLRAKGCEVRPQKAVGRYNVDVALAESRIAVEVFGGNWHTAGRHAARYRPRLEYLFGAGWHPVVVWVTASHPLRHAVADQIFALHEARRRGEPLGRQEHVIRGDGYMAAVAQVNADDGSIVLGFNPGNPHRGDDGRFR